MKVLRLFAGAALIACFLMLAGPTRATSSKRLFLPVVAHDSTTLPPPPPVSQLTLVSSYYSCAVLTGEVHQLLTGQVRNDTSQTRYSVSVTVTFFYTDPSGNTTSNSATSLLLANMIQPGEVVPFNVGAMLPGCTPSPGVYQVTINPGSTTSPTRYTHQFSFTNTRAGLCPNGLFACVTGTVTNTGSVSANSVIVVATLLNPQVQPYCANNLSVGSLAPGQSTSFEISCSTTIPSTFSLLGEGQT